MLFFLPISRGKREFNCRFWCSYLFLYYPFVLLDFLTYTLILFNLDIYFNQHILILEISLRFVIGFIASGNYSVHMIVVSGICNRGTWESALWLNVGHLLCNLTHLNL